jgi:hypothetical protein
MPPPNGDRALMLLVREKPACGAERLEPGHQSLLVGFGFVEHRRTSNRDTLLRRAEEHRVSLHKDETAVGDTLDLLEPSPRQHRLEVGRASHPTSRRAAGRCPRMLRRQPRPATLEVRLASRIVAARGNCADFSNRHLSGVGCIPLVLENPGIGCADRLRGRGLSREERVLCRWPLARCGPTRRCI